MKQVWRVQVVEDDVQMREFFAASVLRCAELELAASLGTVAETLDVLLTDLGLPDDIAQSILDMRAGASPISPMIARKVLAKYARRKGQTTQVVATAQLKEGGAPRLASTLLSPREQDASP